jgi:hypothetical protein
VAFQTDAGSMIRARPALREEGPEVCVCRRSAIAWPARAEAIAQAAGAPLTALRTIDEVYPQRPDRHAIRAA